MAHFFKTLLYAILFVVAFSAQSQTLKVVSFNIRYDSYNKIDGENGWDYRKDAVVRMIRDEQPDAIGLQEALQHQLEYLDQQLRDYRRVGVGRDDGVGEGEFMAIYYNVNRLELLSVKTRWLSETPLTPSLGWDAACRRTVTIAHFRDKETGKEFSYYNTHLDHVGKTARLNGVRLISNLASCTSKRMPVIVGGDMNTTIDDTIFNQFYEVGLESARSMARRASNAITYNAFGKEQGVTIDHFFVKGADVRCFRTLDGNYGVPYISDHYPVAIILRLN